MDVDKAAVLLGDWIKVAFINASQYNIEQVVQTKFQDVGYWLTMSYLIVESAFTQVIHDSNRNHWVTISSLASSQPEKMSWFLIVCFLMSANCLLHTSKSEFTLNFVDVHKQTGSNDCGLLSIAYAVPLSLGENPGALVFD